MAVTQNTYTGDGTTVLFSFTFPYLETTDIKVSLNGTVTTAYTLANATTVQFNTAPANGAAIRIYRQTDDASLAAQFYPGSAIRSSDLNDNFTQNLYVTQESSNNAATATSTANTALTNSNTAISTANSAVSTANTASSNASAAVSTANTASSNASAAVSTANTAASDAANAVTTADAAALDALDAINTSNTALSTANTAVSTANSASTAATTAVNTANAASSAASSAVSTANTASTNASNAVTTANTASTNATTAVNTANAATVTANAAAAAVANAVLYTTVANVAAIPATPANNTAVEVTNSTGIESFTPLSGLPVGFVGSSGLSVRIIYQTAGTTWTWIQYFPNDPEARYLKLAGGTVTGNLAVSGTLTKSGNNVVTVGDTGTVTSTMIANGTIVDADVNASAAIAGTKVSPDFGSQTVQTTGVFSHALGTAGAPTITFTGDTNTGIYSPGADQVAISTGGAGRLFIDASGNVGVGGSPTAYGALTVFSSGIGGHVNSTSGAAGINFYENGAGRFSLRTLNGSAGLSFYDSFNASERLRIDSSGRVGIGTSVPGTYLDTRGFASYRGNAFAIASFAANNTLAPLNICQSTNGTHPAISAGQDSTGTYQPLVFMTSEQRRMFIDAAGNVGIGSNNPQSLLHLETDGTALRIVRGSSIGFLYNTGTASTATTRLQGNDGPVEIYTNATQPVLLSPGGSEKVRCDPSGRLLVGTSSARANFFNSTLTTRFQIEGNGTDSWMSIIADDNSTSSPIIVLGKQRSGTVGGNTIVQSGDEVGRISFQGNDGTDFNETATIAAFVDGTPGANDMPGRLVFSTTADGASSPTERMRIGSDGTSYFQAPLNVVGAISQTSAGTANRLYYGAHSGSGIAGTISYTVWTNGNVVNTNNSYGAISDIKLKENIVNASSQWDDIKALRPVNYNFKEGQTHTQIGLIAQEVELVSPGLVTESPDRDADGNDLGTVTKSVNYSVLYMKAVKALQEAMERIEQLETEMAAVKAQLS